ncbi:hypothetical protein BaRGS_00024614, partial [Batillaria attramentaria]
MNVEDVMRCSFSAWYDKFEDVTVHSTILPIPHEFLDYLNADGVFLPEGSHQGAYSSAAPEDSEDEEKVDWSTEDESACSRIMPECSDFLAQIDAAIQHLGGRVFPKLNWSSPQDASWVSLNNSLMCSRASDICLLLKSSDFITYDLTQPFSKCGDCEVAQRDVVLKPELVLRKWCDINTSSEFRCFVRAGCLVAISQRNHSKFFKHIMESKQEITEDIEDFFAEIIDGNFSEQEDCSYTFDVWRKRKGQVVLVDFNPFGPVTDSLLCVESEEGIQPHALAHFGVPTDFVDLASGEDPFKFRDFLQLGVGSNWCLVLGICKSGHGTLYLT